MSTRLTALIKQHIIEAALKDAFDELEKKLEEQEHQLAERILAFGTGAELLKRLDALPEDILPTENCIHVYYGDNEYVTLFFPYARRMPNKYRRYERINVSSTELSDECQTLVKEKKEVNGNKSDLKRKLQALLGSVTTIKKLIEIWPDGEKYLPVDREVPNLPALPVGDINDLIATCKAKAA